MLFDIIGTAMPSQDTDRFVWLDGTDLFTVRNCYRKVLHCRLLYLKRLVPLFNWNLVWLKQVPSKVSFLVWLIIRERILTREALQQKCFKLASRCEFCQQTGEDLNHLFISCPFTASIWGYFCFGDRFVGRYRLSELPWVIGTMLNLSRRGTMLWKFLPYAISWVCWNERNARVFEGI